MSAPNDDLGAVIEGLKQGRRDQVHRLAAELAANPERMLPSGANMGMTAELQTCIEAVEAVMAENADCGHHDAA